MYITPGGDGTVHIWGISLQLKITEVVCQVLTKVDQARSQKYKHTKVGVVSIFQSPQDVINQWSKYVRPQL